MGSELIRSVVERSSAERSERAVTHSERADPRLVLKATPPRVRKSLLMRPRLSSECVELADKAVIAVHAPGGFGKTSLLGQWRREWLQRGAVVAWLTLDESDDDERFVRGLAVTMRMTTGQPVFDKFLVRATHAIEYNQQVLTEWLSDVANLALDTVLILDDASSLPLPTLQNCLMYLLHNAPSNLKVVVASRRQTGLPVAELMANGQFAAVTADQLRFRFDETSAVLQARFGSRIGADTCGQLHELTEGWPLGLQLAITAIERSANLNEAIAELPDCPADVQRYFVECLTARLPSDQNDFLTRVSIVDAITPDLCQALTGRADAVQLLVTLGQTTPIIVEGVDSAWMRIHRLARAYLLTQFEAMPVAEQREVYGRAAHWLAEHHFWEEAARHARRAGLDDLAYDLAERGMYELMIRGQYASVLNWVEHLPDAVVQQRPRARLAAGWALALSERHGEAAQMVLPVLDGGDMKIAERCEAAVITAAAAYFSDQLDRSAEILAPWADIDHAAAPHVQSAMANHLGAFSVLRGDPEQGRYLLKQRSNSVERGVSGWFDFYMGNSYLWEGRVVLAEKHLRGALQRTERDIGRRSSLSSILAAALAAALWESDQTDEALLLLTHRLDVLERTGGPDALILGYVTAARTAVQQGHECRALNLLEGLCGIGEARNIPRFAIAGLGEQIRMHALQGRGETCAMLARRLEAAVPEGVRQGVGLLALVLACAKQAQGDWDGVRVALDGAGEIAERLHRGREGIQIMLMRALAMKRLGEDGTALLGEAVSLADAYGLRRILVDTHRDLAGWAQDLQSAKKGGAPGQPGATGRVEPVPSAGRIVDLQRSKIAPSPLLTLKERNILQLLERGLTNKEIALGLGVTDETVKWHLKNLFAKLSVGTRKHAVHKARMIGILETAG
jgi:LuxR family transcriptional regulator, maltose regulon positive regulatory protein